MKKLLAACAGFIAGVLLAPSSATAWDYDVHRFINQFALASLPTSFPAFAQTPAARERVAFLAGEADRWRNTPDQPLRHVNGPDHFLDLEELARHGLTAEKLTPFRYEFVAQLAAGRAAHATNFPPTDPTRDRDHTRALIGFLPWTLTEQYSKLKSAFSYLKEFEQAGTPEEIANAQQNVIYLMGVMGHFVGDATQPLHTTKHYNGWVGPNPNHYTTNRTFHAWIDGGFARRVGVKTNELRAAVRPARPPWPDAAASAESFPVLLGFVMEQWKLVEPLYRLDQEGKLSPDGPAGEAGREFLAAQMLKAGQMLGGLWLAAWQEAPPDLFLRAELVKRREAAQGGGSPP